MTSPYLLWHYFNLMHKQARQLPQFPGTDIDQQLLMNSHQANFANLNYQQFQQLQMHHCIHQSRGDPFRANISDNHGISERSHSDFPMDISNLRNQQKLYPQYHDNTQTFMDSKGITKCATSPKSKQSKEPNSPRSPRRSLFTIDAILSKDNSNKTSQISPTPASNNPHVPSSSLSQDLDDVTPHRSDSPPYSPCRSETCSPVQDRLSSRLQPLMHSTPQQYNPNFSHEFCRDGFMSHHHHHAHIYPLPHDPKLQTGHIDDDKLSPHIGNINCASHLSSQNQYHHHHQHYQHLASQCVSSSASESASASSGSNLSSTCSDMSISNSSSNSSQKSYTEKQPRKSGTKFKRVRTIFTPVQLERLEAEFERQQYMVGTERFYLANSLSLSEAQVKVWFQNRRIKWRKQHLEQQQARLARGVLYRDLGPLEDEEDLEDSRGESDMEEENRAEPQSMGE